MTYIDFSKFNDSEKTLIRIVIRFRNDICTKNIDFNGIKESKNIDIHSKYINSLFLGLDEIYFNGLYDSIDKNSSLNQDNVEKNSRKALEKLSNIIS